MTAVRNKPAPIEHDPYQLSVKESLAVDLACTCAPTSRRDDRCSREIVRCIGSANKLMEIRKSKGLVRE